MRYHCRCVRSLDSPEEIHLDRTLLQIEIGFKERVVPEDETVRESMREAGVAWLKKARPTVEAVGTAFVAQDATGAPVLAFLAECDRDDFFIGSRLLYAVRRACPGAGANQVSITKAAGGRGSEGNAE